MTYEAGETFDVPVSWLRGTKWYTKLMATEGTPEERLRRRGIVLNEYTWPSLRWKKGDR